MAQIIKFPAQASKFGYKRVRKRAKAAENQNQLDLFPRPTAQILDFASELSRFEQALLVAPPAPSPNRRGWYRTPRAESPGNYWIISKNHWPRQKTLASARRNLRIHQI